MNGLLENHIILEDLARTYFKKNKHVIMSYLKKYSVTCRASIKRSMVSIQYDSTSTYMGELSIMVLCSIDDGSRFFREDIPLNNLILYKNVYLKNKKNGNK